MAKTIDCTPTWSGMLGWYLTVLEDGNDKGKKIAREELANMAKLADMVKPLVKFMKQLNDPEAKKLLSELNVRVPKEKVN